MTSTAKMTSTDIWNYIVAQYKKNYTAQECTVQKEWEQYFSELFNYRRLFGEIDVHRKIHIGSTQHVIPDIIIRSKETDLFDVELKQYSLPFAVEMEKQLKSYLDLLHISVGVLICQKIYIYIYDFAQSKLKKAEIEFTENNPDGIEFVELFEKDNFSISKVESFIDSQNSFLANINKIKNQLTAENILTLVKLHFEETYSKQEIAEALKGCSIVVQQTKEKAPAQPIGNKAGAPKSIHTIGDNISTLSGDTYAEPDFDYVIIKTKNEMIEKRGSLYEATRYRWHAGTRITQYSFVISVVDTFVKQIYIVDRWYKVGDRWAFDGKEAEGEKFQKLIGKRIPEKYRKQGMASPVVYKK